MDPTQNTRRVVTFPLLLTLRHRIAKTAWDDLTKQVIWTACCVSFFASARLGEILAKEEQAHAPASDLTWTDLRQSSENSILIRIKQPKSGEKNGEYLDLFKFPGYGCCPIAAIQTLKRMQTKAGVFCENMPVFRFANGKNLTMAQFNKTLSELLSDMCETGKNTISCHSFRAGIPSTLSLFPELATSDLIKGWGRWRSDAYTRYTRLVLSQKQNIFSQIADALRSVAPLDSRSE